MKPTPAILGSALLAASPIPDIAPFAIPREGETLAPASPTRVEMTKETVDLTLHRDFASVKAKFWLRNSADAKESLEVGFPSAAQPVHIHFHDNGVRVSKWGKNAIRDFRATVDGEAVEAKPTRKDVASLPEHHNWLCWKMDFAPRGERIVEVEYEVASKDENYIETHCLQARQLTYVLKTGKGWHGPIGHAHITLRAADGLTLGHVDRTVPAPTQQSDDVLEWKIDSFEPERDVLIRYRVYEDAKDAVTQIRAKLQKPQSRQAVPRHWLDLAENLETLKRWREAGEAFEKVHAYERKINHPYRPGYRAYVPPIYRAAQCYRKAKLADDAERTAKAAEAWVALCLEPATPRSGRHFWRKVTSGVKDELKATLADVRSWKE